jgi:hypothetical protein
VQAFVDYYMTDAGINQAVQQVGYVDLPSDKIQGTQDAWSQFEGGA